MKLFFILLSSRAPSFFQVALKKVLLRCGWPKSSPSSSPGEDFQSSRVRDFLSELLRDVEDARVLFVGKPTINSITIVHHPDSGIAGFEVMVIAMKC
jgi:hypothetical protein